MKSTKFRAGDILILHVGVGHMPPPRVKAYTQSVVKEVRDSGVPKEVQILAFAVPEQRYTEMERITFA